MDIYDQDTTDTSVLEKQEVDDISTQALPPSYDSSSIEFPLKRTSKATCKIIYLHMYCR